MRKWWLDACEKLRHQLRRADRWEAIALAEINHSVDAAKDVLTKHDWVHA
jgi:hypothetical protein